MTIHRSAHGFDQAADAYERGRPDYPPEAVDLIVKALGITQSSTVVDLAAGTGKLTRLLVPTGAQIVAVEPVPGMRARLMQLVPSVDVLDGMAEAIPLNEDSVDAITVAQAFHWFQGDQALAEIHRVLRSGGGLALIWNRRDLTQPLQRAIEAIVSPHRGETPAHRSDRWRDAFQHTQLFTSLEEQHIPYKQELDTEGLVDRIASISFIAALPTAHRAEVLEQARSLARDLPERFLLHHVTDVYWCRVRKGNSSSAPENLKANA